MLDSVSGHLQHGQLAPGERAPKLILAVASCGRRDLLSRVMPLWSGQTRAPDVAICCIAHESDIDRRIIAELPFPTIVLIGMQGLSTQRNAILDHVASLWPDAGLMVFFDDDFIPAPSFLAEAERLVDASPDVVLATGCVLADGVKTCGIGVDEALQMIALDNEEQADAVADRTLVDVYNAYGCNMVLRLQPVLEPCRRFDVKLPLYSWLEDVDFSRSLTSSGRIVRSAALRGVHLGTKIGRTPGLRFGYSQIANPLYLRRKGRMSAIRISTRIARNVFANLVRSFKPEPWVDRRGRLAGNFLAFRDLFAGRLSPINILDLR